MRENRQSGSEGGVALITPSLPLSANHTRITTHSLAPTTCESQLAAADGNAIEWRTER
jgi:hypothetical protein